MSSLKILVAYHKPDYLIKSDIFIPIHLGRAVSTDLSKDGTLSAADHQWMLETMIGDDTGDNISALNRNMCEMSGIYWTWKNYDALDNPEYIGFCHYRRLFIGDKNFCLSKSRYRQVAYANVPICYSWDYMKNVLRYEDIVDLVKKYDAIIPEENDLHSVSPKLTRLRDSYGELTLRPEDCEFVSEYIAHHQQRFSVTADNCINSHYLIPFNIFIAKKAIFFEYCAFVFDVLFAMASEFKFEANENFRLYDSRGVNAQNSVRALGFMGELLTTIFFKQMIAERRIRIRRQYICKVHIYSEKERLNMIKKMRGYSILRLLTCDRIPLFKLKQEHYYRKIYGV